MSPPMAREMHSGNEVKLQVAQKFGRIILICDFYRKTHPKNIAPETIAQNTAYLRHIGSHFRQAKRSFHREQREALALFNKLSVRIKRRVTSRLLPDLYSAEHALENGDFDKYHLKIVQVSDCCDEILAYLDRELR